MFFANMDNQQKLLKAIRAQLPKTSSVIEEVAAILSISYDAAHRRVSEKSKFSIEETYAVIFRYPWICFLLTTAK